MTADNAPNSQNRFLAALIITGCIMAFLAIAYIVYTRRGRLTETLQRSGSPASKIFQWVLGGAAVVALLLSLFPRQSPEAGILLYFILWPLLGLQLFVACLPWGKFAQKNPAMTLVAAVIVGFCAFHVTWFMLALAGYV